MAKKKTKKAFKGPTARAKVASRGTTGVKSSAKRVKWFDDKSGAPLIDGYARQLTSFLEALADGQVNDAEVKAQEDRLVKLMKEVEPALDDPTHAKVTQLLCELTAYDILQLLSSMQKARPRTAFRG